MIINLDGSAYIDAHIAKTSKEMPIPPRPAVVVLPGGGYMYCSAREAEPVANQFKAAGCNTFTLFYRVMEEAKDKNPLVDVAKTIHHIREHAEEYHVDPHRIVTIGFSAGGHLSAWIASAFDDPVLEGLDCRPDLAIACYPLVKSHPECFKLLMGLDREPAYEEYAHLCTHNMISEKTSPMFIWHTFTDECVPLSDPLSLADALYKANNPFEMHIFPKGPHGLSVCTEETAPNGTGDYNDPYTGRWVDMAIKWMNKQFGR